MSFWHHHSASALKSGKAQRLRAQTVAEVASSRLERLSPPGYNDGNLEDSRTKWEAEHLPLAQS